MVFFRNILGKLEFDITAIMSMSSIEMRPCYVETTYGDLGDLQNNGYKTHILEFNMHIKYISNEIYPKAILTRQ